jgi:hypothetical protein
MRMKKVGGGKTMRCYGGGGRRRCSVMEEEEEEEEEDLFKADAVNEEDSERDRRRGAKTMLRRGC